jgi:chromosome partitioning protein
VKPLDRSGWMRYLDRQSVDQDSWTTQLSIKPLGERRALTNAIDIVLDRAEQVLTGVDLPPRTQRFSSYALTNFRGGIGKSTLSFNLAYELARKHPCLLLDTCSQKNLSQNLFGEDLADFETTLYQALIVELTGASKVDYNELVSPVKQHCRDFRKCKPCYMIPGSSELFLFPSLLYSQLAQYNQLQLPDASAKALLSLRRIIDKASKIAKPDVILVDTSPFFSGATHLAWMAVEALIIPVRVDQNSVESLELTLRMLSEKEMDFRRFNKQSGLMRIPKVHAIAMTHCGWNRQRKNNPDNSTRFFVEKALEIAQKYKGLFSEGEITDCFYLLDDFHSSGRISGKQRIPLSCLESGQKHIVDGQRLEVNPSVDRYKREIVNLAAALSPQN